MKRLRFHQQELESIINKIDPWSLIRSPQSILAYVVPGGGKSMLPGILAQKFNNFKLAWFVPRLSLARQAAIDIKSDFGIDIRESGNEIDPSRGTRGFVTTHQSLVTNPELWKQELQRHQYLLVIDEIHHAKINLNGESNVLTQALESLEYRLRLLMTGTTETNDNTMIYGLPYSLENEGYKLDLKQFDGKIIRYTRQQALSEKAIVPIEFFFADGPVKWQNKDLLNECRLSKVDKNSESQAIWTALAGDMAKQLLKNCIDHWKIHGDQLLVVVESQATAKRYHAELLKQNISTALAISDESSAYEDIELFRSGQKKALVTCAMAYEGLNVPPISHIACLTHIRSIPWIEQMFARAWRSYRSKKRCYGFVPNDPRMNRVIQAIREQQESIISLPAICGGGGNDKEQKELTFIPHSSELDSLILGALDDSVNEIEGIEKIKMICDSMNLPWDHPAVTQFLSALKNSFKTIVPERTIAQQESDLRKNIANACRTADYQKNADPGTHQKLLFRRTKKSITLMTLAELQSASRECARVCSPG